MQPSLQHFATLCLLSAALAATAAPLSDAIPAGSRGLCIVIGAGDAAAPDLAADLAKRGLLVHGIAADAPALERARKAVSAAKMDGVASIEKLPLAPLPYRDNLANFVIVANAAACSEQEALRVLAPNGKLIVRKDGAWQTTVKPMPKEMDEWTHDTHGPDGTLVSNDKLVRFPVGYRWHAGLPMNLQNQKQPANVWSDTRGLALSGGRCFTLSSTVLENLGATFRDEHGIDQYVTCRDAFNGLLLWRTKIGPTYYAGLYYPNRAPFVAAGGFVYVAAGEGKLWALDATTGKVTRKFDTTFPPCRMLVDDGVVAVACWKEGTRLGGLTGVDRRLMDWAVAEGTVEAFDARSGQRLWKLDRLATSMRSAGGVLFMVQRTGADLREELTFGHKPPTNQTLTPPRPEQFPVAVDLRTGKQLWQTRVGKPELHDTLSVDAAGCNAVAITHNNGRKTSLLCASDGKLLAEIQANGYAAFTDGAVHLGGKKYDPATGKELGQSKLRISSTICTPQYVVGNITIQNRGGTINVDGKPFLYGGTRGACFFASTPAYGQFYTAQNWCMCAPAQIPGFITFGPIAHEPTSEEMEQPNQPEAGSATIQTPKSKIHNAADWPMYRHDPQRSNATDDDAPRTLDVLWRKSVTRPTPAGPLGMDWKESLADALTAPVIAEGALLAAATDRNHVIALDAANGSELWRANVGGRVDTPPTVYGSLCLFGSHDGYIYALARADGRLAWKLRAAPREERMVSCGKVESPWPVIGTVLVEDGVGFASAGRTQGSDGGIAVRAFDALTGKPVWSRALVMTQSGSEYRNMRRNDLLLKCDNALQLMTTRLDPKTGQLLQNATVEYEKFQDRKRRMALTQKKKPTPSKEAREVEETMTLTEIAPGIGLEGFIAATWTRLGDRKYKSTTFGNVSAAMLSWGAQIVCGNGRDGSSVSAHCREKVGPWGQKPDPKLLQWQQKLPEGYQATSVIVCGNAIVVGGGIFKKDTPAKGFARVLSPEKGDLLAEAALDAPLTYNGAAVAGGKIYATLTDGSVLCLGSK
ncbi:MAG: PQQ-binding-like beta-propeller repeat protein [Verrucomicrobia bacterium]|nr:PQQ-binding-like beta-propeller repeat protein [Verrucomicrobiota bacterium]